MLAPMMFAMLVIGVVPMTPSDDGPLTCSTSPCSSRSVVPVRSSRTRYTILPASVTSYVIRAG